MAEIDNEPLTADQLEQIRQLWQAAQSREWEQLDIRLARELVAAAYEQIPALLAEVERLRAELAECDESYGKLQHQYRALLTRSRP
jgi:hypothetical protein